MNRDNILQFPYFWEYSLFKTILKKNLSGVTIKESQIMIILMDISSQPCALLGLRERIKFKINSSVIMHVSKVS